jgi:hypothetical protein
MYTCYMLLESGKKANLVTDVNCGPFDTERLQLWAEFIQVTVVASPPFGGTEIDHPRNTLPLAVKYLEGMKSWAHFKI